MLKAQETKKIHVIFFTFLSCAIGLWYAHSYGNNIGLISALVASAILMLIAMFRHQFLLWPANLWMQINHYLTVVLFYILLGCVFFLLITPIALYRTLTKSASISTSFNPTTESYLTSSPALHDRELNRPF